MTEPTPGVKMITPIQRLAGTSRDELIAHWFANHMPDVIRRNREAGDKGAWRYVATLYRQETDARMAWDGYASLWYDAAPDRPTVGFNNVPPKDTFQEMVEPYRSYATREYVFVDGELPLAPPTLNPPFPCTRSGFLKQISVVIPKPDVDPQALADHWLKVHAPNVVATLKKVGGFRYVVNLAADPANTPFAGVPELYFPDRATQDAFWTEIKQDGFHDFVDYDGATVRYRADTEMVGIA